MSLLECPSERIGVGICLVVSFDSLFKGSVSSLVELASCDFCLSSSNSVHEIVLHFFGDEGSELVRTKVLIYAEFGSVPPRCTASTTLDGRILRSNGVQHFEADVLNGLFEVNLVDGYVCCLFGTAEGVGVIPRQRSTVNKHLIPCDIVLRKFLQPRFGSREFELKRSAVEGSIGTTSDLDEEVLYFLTEVKVNPVVQTIFKVSRP